MAPSNASESDPVENPYQPSASVLTAPPVSVAAQSQKINRGIALVIAMMCLLGWVAFMAQGAPVLAALFLMLPLYPAVAVFWWRPCRHAWWVDALLNLLLSSLLAISVVIAAFAICVAVYNTLI